MQVMKIVAELMELAAITAPKTKGENFLITKILEGEQIQQLAKAMLDFAESSGKPGFTRDAESVKASEQVLLLGIKDAKPAGLNCGACGFASCESVRSREIGEWHAPQCAFRYLDLGIALGSAVKTASDLRADNRIMYRIGAAARKSGMILADFVMGIPISASGKNIYFDRRI